MSYQFLARDVSHCPAVIAIRHGGDGGLRRVSVDEELALPSPPLEIENINVTIQVVSNLLLTSKQQFRFSRPMY